MLIKYESTLWNSSKWICFEPLIKSFRNLQYWKCLVGTVKHERCLHFTQQIVTHVKAASFQQWNIMKLLCFAHTTACSFSFSLWPVVKPAISHQAPAIFFFFFLVKSVACTTASIFFLLQPHLNVTPAVETQSLHVWWWTVQMLVSLPILQKWNLPAITKWSFLGKYYPLCTGEYTIV